MLRVVVAAEEQGIHDLIQRAVSQRQGARVVGAAFQGAALIDAVTYRAPQLAFITTRLGAASGYDLAAQLSRRHPGMYIVLIAPHAVTPEDLHQAMRAGARECLPVPLNDAAILRVLGDAGDLEGVVAEHRGVVLVVLSSKGGVGKSTVAVNLAIALKDLQGGRVALVDGDLYFGDVAALMNIRPARTIRDLSDALDPAIAERFLTRHASGVDVLAAPLQTALAEDVQPERFRETLNVLQGLYDLIVTDVSVSTFDVMLASLEVADLALVLTTLDVVCVKDTSQVLEMLAHLRFPLNNLLLVGNRVEDRVSLARKDVEKTLGTTFTALLPRDDKVVAAANNGTPVVIGDPDSSFAVQIKALAKRVDGALGRMDRATA